MSGIRVIILRRDFTLARKKIDSKASHVHWGSGSYLNMEAGILATQKRDEPPVLLFQEGIATPKGVAKTPTRTEDLANIERPQEPLNPLEAVKWNSWYLPMLRGLNRQHHGRGNLMAIFKQVVNLKTLPFWVIGLAVLAQLLSGG